MALTPNLTPLDRRVLEAVRAPRRLRGVYEECGPWWPTTREDVLGILRGLEHLGLVKRKAGGWWVAT